MFVSSKEMVFDVESVKDSGALPIAAGIIECGSLTLSVVMMISPRTLGAGYLSVIAGPRTVVVSLMPQSDLFGRRSLSGSGDGVGLAVSKKW